MMSDKRGLVALTVVFVAGFSLGSVFQSRSVVRAQGDKRVFEMRTYTSPDGKLGDLDKRFRDHTLRIFKKHGMENVGYWHPQEAPLSQNTLIYIISHANRDAAKKSWAAFGADPEWQKVAAESQVNGRLTSKIESVFMDPTDYSPIK